MDNQYTCPYCYGLVDYGKDHPCFNYKNEDNMHLLQGLEGSDRRDEEDDGDNGNFSGNWNSNSSQLYSEFPFSENERSEQIFSPLIDMNEKFSFLSFSERERQFNLSEEITNNAQLENTLYPLFPGSVLNVQTNEEHFQENGVLKYFSETADMWNVAENEDFGRNSAGSDLFHEQNESASNHSNLLLATPSEEWKVSLEEGKWQSFINDQSLFMDNLECVSHKALSDGNNCSERSNFQTNPYFSPGYMESDDDMVNVSGGVSIEQVLPEENSEVHSQVDRMAVEMNAPFSSDERDISEAGPSGVGVLKRKFCCSLCPRQFKTKSSLVNHLRTHNKNKSFQCTECELTFSKKSILKRHLTVHTGEKLFGCDECGRRFSSKSTLESHYRTHTGEKPFFCHLCANSFTQRSSLVRHLRTHTGEKPYKCSVCGKEFTNSYNRNLHQSTKHK